MSHPATRNLAILLTDIKGFTDKTSRKSRSEIQAMLDSHRELVLPLLERGGGRLVKTIGDAFLMVFESPTDAVLAGVAVQEELRRFNGDKADDDRIEVRIAINCGEVNLSDNDIFGEPVNITARIEGVAEAGEVFFTEAVYLAMNKSEVPSSEVGLLQLKGIPEKIRVYKVKREHPVGASGPRPSDASKAHWAPAAPEPSALPPRRASFARRGGAWALDLLLCALLSALVGATLRSVLPGPRARHARMAAAQQAKSQVSIGPRGVDINDGATKVSIRPDGAITVLDDDERVSVSPGGRVAFDDASTVYDRGGLRVNVQPRRPSPFPIVWVLYSFLSLASWGTTPAGRILGLKVVGPGGLPLDPKTAALRSALLLLSAAPMMLGFAWALFSADKRGWHDKLAGTNVVAE